MKNPNGSIVVVLLNRSNEEVPVALRIEGQVVEFLVPASS
ncbi:glycoside hydrolase family 30 beta sandwich domain-containing protein, partial [Paenibacillus terrae]